ncbi:MAG: hypothetical protein HYY01_01405 [Chloroflexi bacterium]|nr:hypothetical protein [Chloroflexota bacterium]
MPTDQELRDEVRRRLESFCQERGYHLSAFVEAALNDFVRMYRLYGDLYCPCQVEQTPDTICVCTSARQGLVDIEGACFCGLVVLPPPGNAGSEQT